MERNRDLEKLVDQVGKSRKYQSICRDVIRQIALQELTKRRPKEALKATKNKLHQVAGAYSQAKIDYTGWLQQIENEVASTEKQAVSPHIDGYRSICRTLLSNHTSTRERLPILDSFYTTLLADLPQISSIADFACGLNPLTLPWMWQNGKLNQSVTYHAYDIYHDLADFLNGFFQLCGIQGHAHAQNILQSCPVQPVDVALLLKAIPCLEQIDRSAGAKLLGNINAPIVLVSFPAQTLGGRDKQMVAHYETHFRGLVAHTDWAIEKFEFETELVFRIRK